MEITSKSIKISGEFEISETLQVSHDYKIEVEGTISERREKDDNGGGMELVYVFKPKLGQIQADKGKTIQLKDKRRNSQKLRSLIEMYRQENAPEREEESFYDGFMAKLMAFFPEIVEFMKKLK